MNRQRLAAVWIAALLAPTPGATAQDSRSRDSAGVRIIENSARKDAPVRFTLGDKPLIVVGGTESNPDEEFDQTQGYLRGIRLSNGGLAVIDVSRVHYFDANGKRTRIVGRKRPAPGEFFYLTSICRTRGDALLVNDEHDDRVTVLDGSGGVVRTFFRKDNGSAPFNFCLGDGTFVLERALLESRQHRVTRLRTDGTVLDVAGTFDASGFDMVTQVAPTISAFGDALYYSVPFRSEIHEYDALGRLRRIIRTADQGDLITDAEAEERMDRTIPLNVTGAARTARMEQMRARPHARNWPAFSRFEIGSDGTIWVQDFRKSIQSPDAWTAIDSTGRIVGRLVFPPTPEGRPRTDVQSFGRDYVMIRRSMRAGPRISQ